MESDHYKSSLFDNFFVDIKLGLNHADGISFNCFHYAQYLFFIGQL